MRRWNGWGNPATDYPVPPSALDYLRSALGELQPTPDATLEQVLAAAPVSRIAGESGLSVDAGTRLRHALGQSLPDWIAMRSGNIPGWPDAVVFPQSKEDVHHWLMQAHQRGWKVIPYGGGTSVVGHLNVPKGDQPVLSMDLSRLNRLVELDETSRLATFEAGVAGPHLEEQLMAHGYRLGHYPQSFELSTLGGWIVTRSSGQQSYRYGRIEDLFAGGTLVSPSGEMLLPCLPATAAGPDLRQVVLGSEGRLGVLTHATVRVSPLPSFEDFYGVFFPNWVSGVHAMRAIAQTGIGLSMLRLSNPLETETTLLLSGKADMVRWAERGLSLLGIRDGRCLLLYGVSSDRSQARSLRGEADALCRSHGGLPVGTYPGRSWEHKRFLAPYLRNTLWDEGIAIDTLESAFPWSRVAQAEQDILAAIRSTAEANNLPVLAFAHLSHVYTDGASLYITFLFPRHGDPQALLHTWQQIKHAASLAITALGGTISHQHGVGDMHAPYLAAEKGKLGLQAIQSLIDVFDPHGLMNPGKLLPAPVREVRS